MNATEREMTALDAMISFTLVWRKFGPAEVLHECVF
jgi:hypothetical protein